MNLWQIICVARVVAGHSWIDNIFVSTQPSVLGYPRNYAGHDAALTTTQYKVLVNDLSTAACGPSQQGASYSSQYPMLVAPAGSEITATYLENGHVTKDKLPPDNLPHPGNYSWFISSKSSSLNTFADLNSATLLTGPSPFDDGRCAVDAAGIQGRQGPIDCLSKITLPASLAPGLYQLVWWWDFTKLTAIDPTYTEWYTTCLDVQITAASGGTVAAQKAGTLELSSPKYTNTTYISTSAASATAVTGLANVVAPKAAVAALAASKVAVPLQEQDVVVVSSVTSTYTYDHPTIIGTTTITPSSTTVPSSSRTYVAAVNTYIPTSMQVNPIDGSLSPFVLAINDHQDAKSSSTSSGSSSSSTSSSSISSTSSSSSVAEEQVTVFVPVYITVDPTDCPVPSTSIPLNTSAKQSVTTVTSVVQVTLTQTQSAPTIIRRHHSHSHGHHAH